MTQVTRDSNGRFSPGNPGGPGRKPREIEQEYIAKMESIVSGDAWEAIVQKAKDDAIQGDSRARAWLSGYLLGQPIARVESAESESGFAKLLRQLEEVQLDFPTLPASK